MWFIVFRNKFQIAMKQLGTIVGVGEPELPPSVDGVRRCTRHLNIGVNDLCIGRFAKFETLRCKSTF